MWRRAKSGAAVAAVLLAGALSLSGCGGDEAEAQPAPSGGGRDDQFSAYLTCLRDNGVVITRPTGRPDRGRPGADRPRPSGEPQARGSDRPGRRPGGGVFGKPADVDDATWEKAQQACGSLRPARRPGGRGPGAAYRNCLRDQGVSLGDLDRTEDPETSAALAKCAPLRPSGPPRAD